MVVKVGRRRLLVVRCQQLRVKFGGATQVDIPSAVLVRASCVRYTMGQ